MASASGASFAPPLAHLASTVRNASEAAALVDVDLLALRHEVLHDHLLACCAHERDLERAHHTISRAALADPQLLAAASLCASALVTVRDNIELLVAEVDEVLQGVHEAAATVRRYAEGNEALVAELIEDGAPCLAASKQRLWLVEESLAFRMDTMLSSLRNRMTQTELSESAAGAAG